MVPYGACSSHPFPVSGLRELCEKEGSVQFPTPCSCIKALWRTLVKLLQFCFCWGHGLHCFPHWTLRTSFWPHTVGGPQGWSCVFIALSPWATVNTAQGGYCWPPLCSPASAACQWEEFFFRGVGDPMFTSCVFLSSHVSKSLP